jgi:hypothetical protein
MLLRMRKPALFTIRHSFVLMRPPAFRPPRCQTPVRDSADCQGIRVTRSELFFRNRALLGPWRPRPTRRARLSRQKSGDFRRSKEALSPAAATDTAGAANKTPSPGFYTPNTDHTDGQPAPLLRADETHAPKARRLVHQGNTAKSQSPRSGPTLRGEDWGARIRTWDHGTKTRCLTAWLRPNATSPEEYR